MDNLITTVRVSPSETIKVTHAEVGTYMGFTFTINLILGAMTHEVTIPEPSNLINIQTFNI